LVHSELKRRAKAAQKEAAKVEKAKLAENQVKPAGSKQAVILDPRVMSIFLF
jgi:hypothetical protein